MARKIAKWAAVAACIAATAASTLLFGLKGLALAMLQLCAFAVWAANEYAEYEEMVIEETVMATMKLFADEGVQDEK